MVRHPLRVISSLRRCFCGKGVRETARGTKSELKSWEFVEKYLALERFLPGTRWEELPVDDVRRAMV